MRLRTLMLLAALSLPGTAQAQSASYTGEDDAVMLQCFAQVDEAAEVDAGGGASQRDCIAAASNACREDKSSIEVAALCNAREQAWWDAQMNDYLARLAAGLAPETADRLRKTQNAWLDYRDARCDYDEILWGEGTQQITGSFCSMKLTAERAIDLSFDLDAIVN